MKTPFLWAGSKDRDYKIIKTYIPEFKVYAEPFLGGGAVYFRLLAERGSFKSYCADINADLINTYTVMRDAPEDLIAGLPHTKDKETFQAFLKEGMSGSEAERAARFLYCNRNRFFGMGGWMNADRYARATVIERIRFFSPLMQETEFSDQGCEAIPLGDFTFCDPPYPETNNEACYRAGDIDALKLNKSFLSKVGNHDGRFFWVTKYRDDLDQLAKTLPGTTTEKREWTFRKPGKLPQTAVELYAYRH